jgi:fructokinase
MIEQASGRKVVCYGEILWDILPSGALPGGAPMNVAYHLHKLNRDVSLITRIGSDSRGRELLNRLSELEICTDYIGTDQHQPTGIVYAQPKGPHEMEYDIVYPSAWDFIGWEDAYTTLMQQADYLVFGSLIGRHAASRNTLFQLLDSTALKVLDINIRPPHFSRTLIEQLLQNTDILKLNLSELDLIAGWYSPVQTVTDKIQLIRDRFFIKTMVVTLGGEGAILSMNGKLYKHPGYTVQVADTVGSGDAFLAAFLSKLMDNAPAGEMLDYACATGALIASYTGACPDYDAHKINELSEAYAEKRR